MVRNNDGISYAAGNSGQMSINTTTRLCTADFKNDLNMREVVGREGVTKVIAITVLLGLVGAVRIREA